MKVAPPRLSFWERYRSAAVARFASRPMTAMINMGALLTSGTDWNLRYASKKI